MIFRKRNNSEEISFCNVDTPEEALELMFDPMATDHDEIMEKMVPTLYGFHAAMPRKPDGEPGDFWEIKGYANAEDKEPAEVRHVDSPVSQIPSTDHERVQYMKELIMQGTNNWEGWIKENPRKASEILKVFYENILDAILSG